MVEITPVAGEQLRTLASADPSRAFLRLYVAGRGCCSYRYGIAFDRETEEGDSVMESQGIRIVVDGESSPHCGSAVIDFVTTDAGTGFTVRAPRIEGGCTCGRS
jgi:iron-sulfur cluster assembly accessory protein